MYGASLINVPMLLVSIFLTSQKVIVHDIGYSVYIVTLNYKQVETVLKVLLSMCASELSFMLM